MEVLKERDDTLCAHALVVGTPRRPSLFFNSFFMTTLLTDSEYEYAKVIKWTKKVDVFDINIPDLHWAMAVVYIDRK